MNERDEMMERGRYSMRRSLLVSLWFIPPPWGEMEAASRHADATRCQCYAALRRAWRRSMAARPNAVSDPEIGKLTSQDALYALERMRGDD